MQTTFKNPVAKTCCWIAAARALESGRPDRLFDDPYAPFLHQPADLEAFDHLGPDAINYLALRTRYLDDLCRLATHGGIRQVVDVAAGMDTRAFRLTWPMGTRFFELDRPEVLNEKSDVLAGLGAVPACERRTVAVDLTADWPASLLESGFEPGLPTLWLVEGLLMYLDPPAVDELLATVSRLAASGSLVGADVAGARVQDPVLRDAVWARFGFYWQFGTDDPAPWFDRHGWQVRVDDPGAYGRRWERGYNADDLVDCRLVRGEKR